MAAKMAERKRRAKEIADLKQKAAQETERLAAESEMNQVKKAIEKKAETEDIKDMIEQVSNIMVCDWAADWHGDM